MSEDTSTHPHPLAKRVPLLGGSRNLWIKPFSVGQVNQIKPTIIEIIEEFFSVGEDISSEQGTSMFKKWEPVLVDIIRDVVELPDDLKWEDLDYEDILECAKTIWTVSLMRPDGGGILGKLLRLSAVVSSPPVAAEASSNESTEPSATD